MQKHKFSANRIQQQCCHLLHLAFEKDLLFWLKHQMICLIYFNLLVILFPVSLNIISQNKKNKKSSSAQSTEVKSKEHTRNEQRTKRGRGRGNDGLVETLMALHS